MRGPKVRELMVHPCQGSNVSSLSKTKAEKSPGTIIEADGSENPALSGLLVALSPICPSLNKHKGVFARQLHFTQTRAGGRLGGVERQA